MNLIQKMKRYFYLRNKGVRFSSALKEFYRPLSIGDWFFIVFVFCILGIFLTLSYKNEIDGNMAFLNNKITQQSTQINQYEGVLVNVLNGDYIRVDGLKRKVQLCNAAGDCH